MQDPVKVVVLGTGQMGAGCIRLLDQKPGLRLVGAFGRRSRPQPLDVGTAAGLERTLGFAVSDDLEALLADTAPVLAIQTTCSTVEDAEQELRTLLEHGVNVITIAEEMAWPAYSRPQTAVALDTLARERAVSLLGTGINPGFVLDLLIVTLSGVCHRVDAITGTRINDLSPYGPTVVASQGVGLSPQAFADGLANGAVVGHFGFPESLSMIAHALGWNIEHIEQSREPIIATVARETPFVRVAPGDVAGCRHTGTAYVDGRPAIRLVHPQQVQPEREGIETGDFIDIEGEPSLRMRIEPEIPGGLGTIALAVNMIPRVLAASPGLTTMVDLPVPAAVMGDVRALAGGLE